MGSHYIPVGKIKIDKDILDIVCPAAGYDSTPPPPEIYCPVNGFIPDPTIYHEDPVITEAPRPGDGQIRLIVTDSGSRHIQFRCTVSNAGKYVVTITGVDDTVVLTQTVNNNAVFSTFVPLLEGYPADSYTYYYVDIAPELETNDLTVFISTINATYDSDGGYIIAAFFNAPGLTSLYQAFNLNKRIKIIEVLVGDNITTLVSLGNGASELNKLVLPKNMPELTTIASMLSNSGILDLTFPEYLPLLTIANNVLYGTKLKSFTFPSNLPLLENINRFFYNSEIQEIKFLCSELPALTTAKEFCANTPQLKGKIKYPEMPNVIDVTYLHNESAIEEIEMTGNANSINSLQYFAVNAYNLKKITFPTSMLGITSIKYKLVNVVDNCNNLEEIIMPKYFEITSYENVSFFNSFKGCYKLNTISTLGSSPVAISYGSISNFNNLLSLKRWDQPNFYNNYLNVSVPEGVQGVLEYVDINWNDFQDSNIDLRRQNISIVELKRILSKLVKKSDTIYSLYLTGNPNIDISYGEWNPNIASNRSCQFLKTNFDPRIKIGTSLWATQGNNYPLNIVSADSFKINIISRNVAPLNGSKVRVFTNDYSAFGLITNKTYYIVDSDEDSGINFKLSDTENGTAINFGFGINEIGNTIQSTQSNYVYDIQESGSYFYCYLTHPYLTSSGTRYGFFSDPDYFDIWEILEKGWRPA